MDPGILDDAAERLAAQHGFTVDVGHVALTGTCVRAGNDRSPLTSSPLLARPGAVQQEVRGRAHYGDPLREQRLLAEGAGLSTAATATSSPSRAPTGCRGCTASPASTWTHSPTAPAPRPWSSPRTGTSSTTSCSPTSTGPPGPTSNPARVRRSRRSCRRCGSCSASNRRTSASSGPCSPRGPEGRRVLPAGLPAPEATYEVAGLDAGFVRCMPPGR